MNRLATRRFLPCPWILALTAAAAMMTSGIALAQDDPTAEPPAEEQPPAGAAPADAAPAEEQPPAEPAAAPTQTGGGLMAPATRVFFGGLHLGGAIKLKDSVSQFKLGQEFGWHFLSQTFGGPAVGLYINESFGDSTFIFQVGPKAWWHFQILSTLGLYVGPFVQLGLVHSSVSVDTPLGSVSGSDTGFNWQIGVDGRMVFANRFYVLFKPFGLDFFHTDAGTSIRWDLQVGGGVLF